MAAAGPAASPEPAFAYLLSGSHPSRWELECRVPKPVIWERRGLLEALAHDDEILRLDLDSAGVGPVSEPVARLAFELSTARDFTHLSEQLMALERTGEPFATVLDVVRWFATDFTEEIVEEYLARRNLFASSEARAEELRRRPRPEWTLGAWVVLGEDLRDADAARVEVLLAPNREPLDARHLVGLLVGCGSPARVAEIGPKLRTWLTAGDVSFYTTFSPLAWILGAGGIEAGSWWLAHGGRVSSKAATEAVQLACLWGKLDLCRWLWSLRSRSTIINLAVPTNFPIRLAASHGHLDVCQWLWETSEGLNVRAWAKTAFWEAASNGHLPVCEWLWDQRLRGVLELDPGANDHEPLRSAAENGHLHVCKWLWSLQTHPEVRPVRAEVTRAFYKAAGNGHAEVCRWLWAVSDGTAFAIDPTLRNNEAIRSAANVGSLPLCEWLWSLRSDRGLAVDPTAANNDAFRLAASNGHLAVCQWLWRLRLDHGIAVDPAVEDNASIINAATEGHLATAQWLWSLRELAPVALGVRGPSIVKAAIFRGDLPTVQWMWSLYTDHGVDLGLSPGRDPFVLAILHGHLHICRWFLRVAPTVGFDVSRHIARLTDDERRELGL